MPFNGLLEIAESSGILSCHRLIKARDVSVDWVYVVKLLLQEFNLLHLVILKIVEVNARTAEYLHVHVWSLNPNFSLLAVDAPVNAWLILEWISTANIDTENGSGVEFSMDQDVVVRGDLNIFLDDRAI
jgi:hypothetical protein